MGISIGQERNICRGSVSGLLRAEKAKERLAKGGGRIRGGGGLRGGKRREARAARSGQWSCCCPCRDGM